MSAPVFRGTPEQQVLVSEVFQLMRLQGNCFAAHSAVRQTLANLADFLSNKYQRDRDEVAQEIDAAIQQNDHIFLRQEADDEVIYSTSRSGTFHTPAEDTRHSFRSRFYEPEKPLPIDDLSVVISTSRPALTSVEPAFVSDYWQERAEKEPAPLSPEESSQKQLDDQPNQHEGKRSRQHKRQPDKGDQLGQQDQLEQLDQHDQHDQPAIADPSMTISGSEQAEATSPDTIIPSSAEELPESTLSTAPTTKEEPMPVTQPVDTEEPSALAEPTTSLDHEQPYDVTANTGEVTEDAEAIGGGQTTNAPEEAEAEVEASLIVAADTEEVKAAEAAVISEVAESGTDTLQETPPPAPPETAEPLEEMAHKQKQRAPFVIQLLDGSNIEFEQSASDILATHGDMLEAELIERLEKDPLERICLFGRNCYPHSSLVTLSKNDIRRIRNYIVEVGEPLSDNKIIEDLYYYDPRNSDPEGFRFSLNYRLSREKKDFEFVGVEGANLWSTKGLSIIENRRVKISEMGQLTSYLTEGCDESAREEDLQTIGEKGTTTRLLTFFEWEYGILPLDDALSTLFPNPMLPDQRTVVLRMDSPQRYTNFLVELRYPTGNRGGWVQGFSEFFHEHVVAGTLITLSRTDDPNTFTIVYEEMPQESGRLLTFDEKKKKFAFTNVTYECVVDEEWLISQKRLSKAKNLKALPMSERRKGEVVLHHVFEVIGEREGTANEPAYRLDLQTLYLAYNILRPASKPYLMSLIESDDEMTVVDGAGSADSTPIYLYEPKPVQVEDEEEELEEEGEVTTVGNRRWSFGDDDEE